MLSIFENATHIVVRGDQNELTSVMNQFRFRPDGYLFATSYQRYKVTGGREGWDGFIYPLARPYPSADWAKALRGHKDAVISAAKLEGIKLDLTNLLDYPFAHITVDDIPPDIVCVHKLDANQRQCICSWLRAGIGFNKVTVGGGKTLTYAGAAAKIKHRFADARFLYITPSERLVKQTAHEMKRFLPHFDIGQCGGGKREFDAKDMVVCTVAMLNRHFETLLREDWLSTFIAVLYDEVHHAGSASSQRILMNTPAYFRLGASDTEKIKDLRRWHEVRGLFGPILNDIRSSPLIESGRLAEPYIYVVNIPSWSGRFKDVPYRPEIDSRACVLLDQAWMIGKYKGPVYELDKDGKIKTKLVPTAFKDDNGEWIKEKVPVTVIGKHRVEIDGDELVVDSRWCLLERMYDRAIIQFKSRNELVVGWAKYFHSLNLPTVVVATRTVHVYILEALLQAALGEDAVRILIGNDSTRQRDETFNWFKTAKNPVLVTPLVKEGVSINEIRAMIVADYVSDFEVARQIIGRAMRPKKTDNRAHIIWFYDNQHPVLRRGCSNLLFHLESSDGFTFKQIGQEIKIKEK